MPSMEDYRYGQNCAHEYEHGGKRYVEVIMRILRDGSRRPLLIIDEGVRHRVDRLLSVKTAASQTAGGCGLCYSCRIEGRTLRLFDEQGRFFIETEAL